MPTSRRLAAVAGITALLAGLVGCSTTVHLEAAKDANNPGCAEVSVLLPPAIGDLERVWTDAQATGAWGSPNVVLRCGVDVPAPSELICQTFSGVDWLVLDQEDDRQRLVSFGRDPAVEVIISRDTELDFATVMDKLSTSIQSGLQPATASCTVKG